jgi:hypothetical protein
VAIPKKAADRIAAGLKRYQSILAEARNRDISESDTVVIVADLLADLLGYRKYIEITTEFTIRSTYVDLAVKVDEQVRFLIEVKAIGADLKDGHVKQAIDYGANQGVEWVILTNGTLWRVYKIYFQQPIDKALVFELDLVAMTARDEQAMDCLGNLSREGFTQSSMSAFLEQQQALGRFSIASIMLSEPVVAIVRRELRRLYPSVKVDLGTLSTIIRERVLKREVIDSDDARLAQDTLRRRVKAIARAKAKEEAEAVAPVEGATSSAPDLEPELDERTLPAQSI